MTQMTTIEAACNFFATGKGHITFFDGISCGAAWGKYFVSPLSKKWSELNKIEMTASKVAAMLCIIPVITHLGRSLVRHGVKLGDVVYQSLTQKVDWGSLTKQTTKVIRVALDIFILTGVFVIGVHDFGLLKEVVDLSQYALTLPGLVTIAWLADDALGLLTTTFKLWGWFGYDIKSTIKCIEHEIPKEKLKERREIKWWAITTSLLEASAQLALRGTPLFVPVTLACCTIKLVCRIRMGVYKEISADQEKSEKDEALKAVKQKLEVTKIALAAKAAAAA